MKQRINIVWLKRDLRSQDHWPLHEAEMSSLPYILIYLFEPSIITYPDTGLRHLRFQYHSILQLNEKLKSCNKEVILFYAEAITALSAIKAQFEIEAVFSYQESGTQITYDRDKAVAEYCSGNNITWRQFQRDGIIRGIKNRFEWDKNWFLTMSSPLIKNQFAPREYPAFKNDYELPKELENRLKEYPKQYQPAGEDFGWQYLKSFVKIRGRNYSKDISKPLESRTSCSRISPYLSWGNLSIKQVYQYVNAHKAESKAAYANMLTRLKWHCHFMQKFEVECSYENKCINSGYEFLEHTKNEKYISAWKEGETGFPLVDACMKCLKATGWLNFRMRAMLVSFFCHHLYQDWRDATYCLARLFLDYEPGIHYPQFQMQAGTTGINTIRIYNPVKQSQEHDPDGVFIKQWLPQLKNVETKYIHEPHKMTLLEQQFCGVIIGKDYPWPVVNIETAAKQARDKIWGHRKNDLVKQENNRILRIHTRRKESDKQP